MAERSGVSEARFLEVAANLLAQGYMRRMAAVLRHREAGFRANAMGVWAVPLEQADEIGPLMGSFRGVSHCYLRPTYADWPYSIFTMVHGHKAPDCQKIIDAIRVRPTHANMIFPGPGILSITLTHLSSLWGAVHYVPRSRPQNV
jgi:DNA-binding Lrp family transcriptional regulator